MEYAAFGDNWGKMGIPQFSPILGDKELATSMGKLGNLWVGDSLIFWGIMRTNPQKTSNFKVGTGTAFLGNLDTLVTSLK